VVSSVVVCSLVRIVVFILGFMVLVVLLSISRRGWRISVWVRVICCCCLLDSVVFCFLIWVFRLCGNAVTNLLFWVSCNVV